MSLEPVFTLHSSILSTCVHMCVKVYTCPWRKLTCPSCTSSVLFSSVWLHYPLGFLSAMGQAELMFLRDDPVRQLRCFIGCPILDLGG